MFPVWGFGANEVFVEKMRQYGYEVTREKVLVVGARVRKEETGTLGASARREDVPVPRGERHRPPPEV